MIPATREELIEQYVAFYPRGSGPLTMMAHICLLLEEISFERGYAIDFKQVLADHGIQKWKHYEHRPLPKGECQMPPNGWACTRPAGHSGPCAAHSDK